MQLLDRSNDSKLRNATGEPEEEGDKRFGTYIYILKMYKNIDTDLMPSFHCFTFLKSLFLWDHRTSFLRRKQAMPTKVRTVSDDESPLAAASRHLYMSNQLGLPCTRFRNSASIRWPSK